jgi:aminoglycoside phosphotransferase
MGAELLRQWQTGPLAPHLQQVQRAETVVIGASGAQVYRLWDERAPVSFLKVAPRTGLTTLADDAARLTWLTDRLPTPRVLAYHEDEQHCYLLTSVIPGVDTATLAERPETDIAQLVRLLAVGLRQIHAVSAADCPFDYRVPREIERVRVRIAQGLLDERGFGGRWEGRTIDDLFAELVATTPVDEDLVLTHGDYCLPNILLDGDNLSGFVDLGRVGVGDRYRDLALARRSLIRNCGAAWVPLLFAEYGVPQPDEAKLTFYELLDEF